MHFSVFRCVQDGHRKSKRCHLYQRPYFAMPILPYDAWMEDDKRTLSCHAKPCRESRLNTLLPQIVLYSISPGESIATAHASVRLAMLPSLIWCREVVARTFNKLRRFGRPGIQPVFSTACHSILASCFDSHGDVNQHRASSRHVLPSAGKLSPVVRTGSVNNWKGLDCRSACLRVVAAALIAASWPSRVHVAPARSHASASVSGFD
jgi:hypothetical protein